MTTVLPLSAFCTMISLFLRRIFNASNSAAEFDFFYPKSFVDFCIKKYLDKVFIKKEVVLKASKKELICVLPFLGKRSMQLRTRLVNSIESNLKFCKLKVIFQSPCKLNLLFRYKDSLQKKIRSDIVYRYMCSNCKVTYYGKTYRHFFTRAAEHMGISNLTGKRLKCVKQSAISDHLLECNCSIDFDHSDILASDAKQIQTSSQGKFID